MVFDFFDFSFSSLLQSRVSNSISHSRRGEICVGFSAIQSFQFGTNAEGNNQKLAKIAKSLTCMIYL